MRSITLQVWLAVVLFAGAAYAVRVHRVSLTELRNQATAIVVATVVAESGRLGPVGGTPWIDYQLAIGEVLAGEWSATIQSLSFAGASAGATEAGIVGVPRLEVGKRYVLFLHDQSSPWAVPTIGWGQGIFEIVESPTARSREALVSYDGEPLLATAAGIARGSRVRVEGGQLLEASEQGTRGSPRAAEPTVVDGNGAQIPQPERGGARALQPLEERPFASLDELRRFVRGELDEAPAGRGRP